MVSSLPLKGNGNNNNGFSSYNSNYRNVGIGNSHHHSHRSNSVNYVDRDISSDNFSSIDSSTTVCKNCLGAMLYNSIKDIWYCDKCRHNDNNNKAAVTTVTPNIDNNSDKPVMSGVRVYSPNAEQQQYENG